MTIVAIIVALVLAFLAFSSSRHDQVRGARVIVLVGLFIAHQAGAF